MFILPSGKWFKLPCFDHLFSLRTQTDKKNKNSSSENRVYFANNPVFGKKKIMGKNASLQTIWTSLCFPLLLFPWQLVEADYTELPSNTQRHRGALLDSPVSQGRACPGKTSCCSTYFVLKSSPPQLPSLVLIDAYWKFCFLEAWISQAPVSN